MITVKVGDWVRIPSLWPGIWMVYRVLSGFREDRWSLDDALKPSKRTLVFCHRLLNDSWQRSFSHQCCEFSLTRALSPPDLKKMEVLLSANPTLLLAFKKYQTSTKRIDLVANLGFGGMTKKEIEQFPRICADLLADGIDAGLTIDDVLHLLRERGLDSKCNQLPQQATLQLISRGHEVRGDRFVYRQFRTLGF